MKDGIFEAKMEERHWEIGLEIITEVVKKFIGCYKDPDSSQEHRCIVRNMLANLSLDSTAVKVNELVLENVTPASYYFMVHRIMASLNSRTNNNKDNSDVI